MTSEPYIYRNGMSSLGSCLKSLVAKRLGYEPLPVSEKMEPVFEAGNKYEEIAKRELRDRGLEIVDEQREVYLWITNNVGLEGHLDGRLRNPKHFSNRVGQVLEIKSMNEENYKQWINHGWDTPGLTQKYKWQVSCYMLATGLPCTFVVIPRTGLDKIELDISTVDEPFYSLEEIRGRVLAIESYASSGELPELCELGTTSTTEYFCPFSYLHEGVEEEVIEDTALDTLGKAYLEAVVGEKVAKKKKQDLYKAIIDATKKKGACKTEGYSYTPWYADGWRVQGERLAEVVERVIPELDIAGFKSKVEGDRVTVRERRKSGLN